MWAYQFQYLETNQKFQAPGSSAIDGVRISDIGFLPNLHGLNQINEFNVRLRNCLDWPRMECLLLNQV